MDAALLCDPEQGLPLVLILLINDENIWPPNAIIPPKDMYQDFGFSLCSPVGLSLVSFCPFFFFFSCRRIVKVDVDGKGET